MCWVQVRNTERQITKQDSTEILFGVSCILFYLVSYTLKAEIRLERLSPEMTKDS